jgi:hypothetical protein
VGEYSLLGKRVLDPVKLHISNLFFVLCKNMLKYLNNVILALMRSCIILYNVTRRLSQFTATCCNGPHEVSKRRIPIYFNESFIISVVLELHFIISNILIVIIY